MEARLRTSETYVLVGAKIIVGGETNGAVSADGAVQHHNQCHLSGKGTPWQLAAYLDEHPDIEEFLQIRSEGHPIQDVSLLCISDEWMQSMIDGDKDKRAIMAQDPQEA